MRVQRVEQQIIRKNNPIWIIVDKHCFYSKNVYNEANYLLRQAFIKENKILTAYEVQKIMQPMDCYKECGSQAAQKTIQLLDENWKSYFAAIKDWKKSPGKYLGMPKLPRYLPKDGRQVFMLKNIQCSLKDGIFRISYKPFKQYTVPTHANGKLMQCRFVPKPNYYVMEIVYQIEVPDISEERNKICSIDLGTENLITMVNNFGEQPVIIKGGDIKSANQFYNKKKAELQSQLKKDTSRDWSNKLQKLTDKRNEKIKYLMHCASKQVVDYCVLYSVDTLIIGLNKKWKQENCNMQNFTYIPYDMFINQLKSKCEENGIEVIITEESYTSGTSFLDNESPVKENYNKDRRVYRGLFVSNTGKKINADVNGAYQIMKKVIPDAFSEGIEGAGLHPIQLKAV
ncbi:RNA-guided endonuclease InsQ/TnpB family protein [Konateibacter massiliensis]|uniref:RNA-guided endonuclease InsQ/TnpB family protein n=1 Tax=Konateibacter massiliensis TaxID=2002841 RepID=UPI001F4020AA|nr:transposase [Konateibacter massiliensis]